MTSQLEKYFEGSGRGLISDNILEFYNMNWGNPRKSCHDS